MSKKKKTLFGQCPKRVQATWLADLIFVMDEDESVIWEAVDAFTELHGDLPKEMEDAFYGPDIEQLVLLEKVLPGSLEEVYNRIMDKL